MYRGLILSVWLQRCQLDGPRFGEGILCRLFGWVDVFRGQPLCFSAAFWLCDVMINVKENRKNSNFLSYKNSHCNNCSAENVAASPGTTYNLNLMKPSRRPTFLRKIKFYLELNVNSQNWITYDNYAPTIYPAK